jgi:ubiquinol-cytochrome c reductase cytochrome c1 subunit
MKKLIFSLIAAVGFVGGTLASEGGIQWDRFPAEKLTDMPALQHGAKLFVNHCLNCHSAAYMRYNRMRDIGLSNDDIKKYLMFATDNVGDTMKTSLDAKQAKEWFGGVPPDLTLVARSRADIGKGSGADYLYTYLRTFYRDDTKATGWNNLAFPDVAMPNALWQLQGQRVAKFTERTDPHDPSKVTHSFAGFEQVSPGTMTPSQFDDSVADLVGFMQWMAEPNQALRVRLGVWVLLFLSLFTVVAWRLNASYWKDVK